MKYKASVSFVKIEECYNAECNAVMYFVKKGSTFFSKSVREASCDTGRSAFKLVR